VRTYYLIGFLLWFVCVVAALSHGQDEILKNPAVLKAYFNRKEYRA
jgi:hypothetical protein